MEFSNSSSGIVNLTLPAKIDTEDSSTQNISVPIVVGGIVGRVDANVATGISNTYNANAVLGNYTNNSSRHSLVGGIVGYAIGRGVNLFTIIDSYNAGLVGAGNTAGGIAVAGGIIGYGNDVTIEGCVNDAQVEAVSESPDGSSDVSAYLKSGVESTGNYMAEPRDLEYYVTLTYNQGQNRQVYAYGLGYLSSGSMTGSATSTNNIKNSGSLGEISQRETLIFDRAAILDNADGSTDYRGKFSAEGTDKIYVNGYDSFGYISRIYMKDTVTRGYFGGAPDGYVNEIEYAQRQMYGEASIIGIHWAGGWYDNTIYYKGIYNVGDNGSLTLDRDGINYRYSGESSDADNRDTDIGSMFTRDDFIMPASTTYYESLNFIRYDEYLDDNVVGQIERTYIGNDSNFATSDSITTAVENGVSRIGSKNELSSLMFTINGKNAVVVYNADNVKSAVSPIEVEATVEIDIAENHINTNNLSNKDFTLGDVRTSDGQTISPQFYSVDFEIDEDAGKVIVTVDMFFAEEVNGTIDFTLQYTTLPFSVTLGQNNVYADNGQIRIDFVDDEGIKTQFSEDMVNNLNSPASWEEGESYTAEVVLIDGENRETLTNVAFGFDSEEGLAYVMYDGSKPLEDFNGKGIEVNITHEYLIPVVASGSISASTQEGTISFSQSAGTGQLTYVGYETSSLPDEFLTNRSDLTTEDGYVYGMEFTLNPAVVDSSRFAFGEEGQYHIRYENGTFFAEDLNEEDGILLSVENNTLRIVVSQTVDNVEVAIDSSTISQSFETEINTFYNEVIGRFSMTIEPRTIYTQDGNILMEGQDNIATDFDDLNLLMYFTPVMNGNFNPFDDSYNNSNGDFSSEVENGSGIESGETTMFGMTFYMPIVTFNYVIERGSLQYGGEEGVGYELTLLDSASQAVGITQGHFLNGETYEISSDIINQLGLSAINLKLNKTSNDVDDFAGYNNLNQFTITSNDGENNYTISKGTETCPVCGEEKSYVETNYSPFRDYYTTYSFSYKVYNCGALAVEYRIWNGGSLGRLPTSEEKWVNSRRFVTSPSLMGKMYVYTPSNFTNNGDTDISFEWNNAPTTEDLNTEYFYSFTPSGAAAGEFATMTADLVVSYFDENNLLFARVPDGFVSDSLDSLFNSQRPKITTSSYSVDTYSTNTETLTINYDDVQYREQNADGSFTSWRPATNGIIMANSYAPNEYQYYYTDTVSGTIEGVVGSAEDVKICEYIILGADIN